MIYYLKMSRSNLLQNIYRSRHEFGIGDAFLLGLTDTVRGVTQFAGGEKVFFMEDDLKTQQAKLNAALQGEVVA